MNVTITPDSEANYILSSIASSKLKLKLDVALAVESVPFRQALQYYSLLGMQNDLLADKLLSLLRDDAVSIAMTKAATLDRICAMIDTEPVRVIKPSKPDPIIFDDPQPSGSGSNKEPQ